MKYLFLTIFLFLNSTLIISQNIQVKVIDENTKYPIPYAAIKIDDFNGVISNEEGFFTLNPDKLDFITVSCLGYKSKDFSIDDIKKNNNIISLDEAINELNTVYISNKRPNVDSIIARTKQRLTENYGANLFKYELFSRQTAYIDFKDLNFEVEKASHFKKKNLELANRSLDSLARAIMNSKTIHFKDFKADLFMNDSTKMVVHKATELLDQKNSLSFDDVQKKGQNVMLKYLDTTLTYKLKTGLFKIEDSLSLKDDSAKNKEKNEYEIDNLRSETNSVLKRSQFGENSILTNILDNSLYEYKLENISNFNNELLYVISYKPKKSRSKYTGKLYITDENYAITKVDFEYADGKRGEKFNLKLILGVKYIENMMKGTIIYQKNLENKYQPQYIKYEEGRYFYVSRPLKFIENSLQKNKTSFDFTIEGNILTKEELLVTSSTKISAEQYQNLMEEKTIPYIKLSKYDPTIWGQERTLEPLEEMKQFNSTFKED
jgi:hypothetical protein